MTQKPTILHHIITIRKRLIATLNHRNSSFIFLKEIVISRLLGSSAWFKTSNYFKYKINILYHNNVKELNNSLIFKKKRWTKFFTENEFFLSEVEKFLLMSITKWTVKISLVKRHFVKSGFNLAEIASKSSVVKFELFFEKSKAWATFRFINNNKIFIKMGLSCLALHFLNRYLHILNNIHWISSIMSSPSIISSPSIMSSSSIFSTKSWKSTSILSLSI